MTEHSVIFDAIRAALDATAGEGSHDARCSRDVAFHMTDWLKDLQQLHDFCTEPEALAPVQIRELLYRFLVHVPNHVAAAGKLLTGVPVSDIFEVGAVECEHQRAESGDAG